MPKLDRNANNKTRLRRNAQRMRTEALLEGLPLASPIGLIGGNLTILPNSIGADQLGIVTTKGDILIFTTEPDRLPIGPDGYVLTADASELGGMKWAPSTGSGGGALEPLVHASASPDGAELLYHDGDIVMHESV